jgi:hypothetical protein
MDILRKTLAGTALAGLLVAGGASAPAFAGDDNGGHKDERNNGQVDLVIKYKNHHGKWEKKEYEDVSLKKAASIAKDKADGGKWDKYYRDAKYTDRTGKTVHTVDKHKVDVYFKQDEDKRHDHGKDERNNNEVDVTIKYKNHYGKWEKKEYENVSLKKAASIAKDKADGGSWDKYYRDAKYTDRTGKTVHTVDKDKVDVWFKQDNDDKDHGHKR